MSYSEITRGGESVRPEFDFDARGNRFTNEEMTGQLLASLRNLNEQFLRLLLNEMQIMRTEAEQQTAILRRIDRRLATKVKIRGHK